MQVHTGKEKYEEDKSSYIKKLNANWWTDLDEGIQKEVTDIFHKVPKVVKFLLMALDWIIRTIALSGSHWIKIKLNKDRILDERSQWPFYRDIAFQHDPDSVFKKPPAPKPEEVKVSTKKTLNDGEIVRVKMPSSFHPINPYFEDIYWPAHQDTNIKVEIWKHNGETRPTIIFMHGYQADAPSINAMVISASKLYKQGYNICLLILPFHKGKLSLGLQIMNFFGNGPAYTTEVFAHAVHDCRSLIAYLLENAIASKLCVSGISLGSFVTSLVISSDDRVDCAFLLEPVYNLPESFMEWFPLKGLFQKMLTEENISFEEFRQSYALCNALTYTNKVPSSRIRIITGVFDIIALPKHARLLGEHWGQCDLIWKDYSHVGMTSPQPFYHEIKEHFDNIGF